MNKQDFKKLYEAGLRPIPLTWNKQDRKASAHLLNHGEFNDDEYTEATLNRIYDLLDTPHVVINAVAYKLLTPWAFLDFDMKNSRDRGIFKKWSDSIPENVLNKCYLESTRNGGIHVLFKYGVRLNSSKIASNREGGEVIAIKCNNILMYAAPTPGYSPMSIGCGDPSLCQDLTSEEIDAMIDAARVYDEYEGIHIEKTTFSFPVEYETACLKFNSEISDNGFDIMLNDIGLSRTSDRPHYKYKYIEYRRSGTKQHRSAVAYFGRNKKVIIFSTSLPKFPSHSCNGGSEGLQNISPAALLYYKHDMNWPKAMEELRLIADSEGIELEDIPDVTDLNLLEDKRLILPVDVFPNPILDLINKSTMPSEHMAAGALAVLSSSIGISARLVVSGTWVEYPCLYMALVGYPGSTKSPALKTMVSALNDIDSESYKVYVKELQSWNERQEESKKTKDPEPQYQQIVINDATIEKVFSILKYNETGCLLYADEMAGFIKRMDKYNSGDDMEKWLEIYNSNPVMIQRINRGTDRINKPFCSIVGGIQPSVVNLMTKPGINNGFYHRFLFCHPGDGEFVSFFETADTTKEEENYHSFIRAMVRWRNEYSGVPTSYKMSNEATLLYGTWCDNKKKKVIKFGDPDARGIVSKYVSVALRISLILQRAHDMANGQKANKVVTEGTMEKAIRLTEYFFANMNKIKKIIAPETPIDTLENNQAIFYKKLPEQFSTDKASSIAEELNIKDNTFRSWLRRWSEPGKKQLFEFEGKGKAKIYTKIYK